MRRATQRLVLGVLLGCLGLASCTSWQTARRSQNFTIYTRDQAQVDLDLFERTLGAAFDAVEARMGSFRRRIDVHAMPEPLKDSALPVESGGQNEVEGLEKVPGIGAARVRAWHVRGGALPFSPSGVFLATSEMGTSVHELVHARLAEEQDRVPLWFEEGLATLLGDGAEFDRRWVVDGLACWPLRELRAQELSNSDFKRLLELSASDRYDARENLLVHFVGWALVFDLVRETPDGAWRDWLANWKAGVAREGLLQHARLRLERSLDEEATQAWLVRLKDPAPQVRFAAAKGLWKLRSIGALESLIEALAVETDSETKACLALNALLCSTEMRVGRSRWRKLVESAFPVLKAPGLADPVEDGAMRELYEAMRWSRTRVRTASECLGDLERFWEE